MGARSEDSSTTGRRHSFTGENVGVEEHEMVLDPALRPSRARWPVFRVLAGVRSTAA